MDPYWSPLQKNFIASDTLGAADLNRVESNTLLVKAAAESVGYLVNTLSTKTNWDRAGIPLNTDLNRIEGNMDYLRTVIGTPDGWISPLLSWVPLLTVDYITPNRWENNLAALMHLLMSLSTAYRYSGQLKCGQARTKL